VGDRKVTTLSISRRVYDALLTEARRALPNECCGLLGGRAGEVMHLFPATNELASPTAFEIPPRELFEIFRRLRAEQLELVGIYHSHPTGKNAPSARDVERAYYPETPYIIVSPRPQAPRPVRAFLLAGESVRELGVVVGD
jgi:proteasome lid subunit RPN8/RPN11